MSIIASFLAIYLTIHAANSYILLTANLEDVQAIAKQLANSPVADQFNKIWRRATNTFNAHVAKPRPFQRTREDDATPLVGRGDHFTHDEPPKQHQAQHHRRSMDVKVRAEGDAAPDHTSRLEEAEPVRHDELHESYLSAHEDMPSLSLEGRRKNQRDNEEIQKKTEEDEDLVALGRNASVYLKSIRRIFQDM